MRLREQMFDFEVYPKWWCCTVGEYPEDEDIPGSIKDNFHVITSDMPDARERLLVGDLILLNADARAPDGQHGVRGGSGGKPVGERPGAGEDQQQQYDQDKYPGDQNLSGFCRIIGFQICFHYFAHQSSKSSLE